MNCFAQSAKTAGRPFSATIHTSNTAPRMRRQYLKRIHLLYHIVFSCQVFFIIFSSFLSSFSFYFATGPPFCLFFTPFEFLHPPPCVCKPPRWRIPRTARRVSALRAEWCTAIMRSDVGAPRRVMFCGSRRKVMLHAANAAHAFRKKIATRISN